MKQNTPWNSLTSMLGEVLVIGGAALWIGKPQIAGICMGAGTLAMLVGRLCGRGNELSRSVEAESNMVMRRLYRNRLWGLAFLTLAAVAINLPLPGFVLGFYLRRSAWLLPFVLFAVCEIYTTFRISSEEGKMSHGEKKR